MPAERTYGMDHDHYAWSPMPSRASFSWPDGASVAFAVIVLLEHAEYPLPRGVPSVALPGGPAGSNFPAPNLPFYCHREYGHRIGAFRILEALKASEVPVTAAFDAMTAERYPALLKAYLDSGAEIVAHGISASRPLTSQLSIDDERSYIAQTRDRLRSAGASAEGWLGPEQSESEHTPELLDALGFRYVCDWPNDEQPYHMQTPGRLISLPTQYFLDDGFAVWNRPYAPDHYPRLVAKALGGLLRSAAEDSRGRTLVLVVRPWLSGQPFRIGSFEEMLATTVATPGVWPATAGAICSAFAGLADSHGSAGTQVSA
jgi:allantoinase